MRPYPTNYPAGQIVLDEKAPAGREFRSLSLSQSIGLIDRQSREAEILHYIPEAKSTWPDVERSTKDLKRLIEQSDKANREAQGLTRGKDNFIAKVNGIIGVTAVLLSGDLAPLERECVETIRSSGEALLAIIGDFPDVSQTHTLHARVSEATHSVTAKKEFRILLVEDNPINQRVALLMLDSLGYHVALAQDGIDAVNHVARHHYDLILMDCLMPEMDGFEATRRIRAAAGYGAQVPIIAMAASVFPKDRQACFDAGMTDYLSKPVREPQLKDKLHHWLLGPGRASVHSMEAPAKISGCLQLP